MDLILSMMDLRGCTMQSRNLNLSLVGGNLTGWNIGTYLGTFVGFGTVLAPLIIGNSSGMKVVIYGSLFGLSISLYSGKTAPMHSKRCMKLICQTDSDRQRIECDSTLAGDSV